MNPIEPTMPLAITLTAQEWNQVLGILGEGGPWRLVNPLISKIAEQAQIAAAAPSLPAAGMQTSLLNGADPQPQMPAPAPAL